MSLISLHRLIAALSCACSVLALTCNVAGGTSDDGPAIAAALSSCDNGGTVVLDKTYTIGSVLQTTSLNNVAIDLTGTIKLSPGKTATSAKSVEADLSRHFVLEIKWCSAHLSICIHGLDNWRIRNPYLWWRHLQWKW